MEISIDKKQMQQKAGEYLLCFVGALIVSVGVYFFKFPNHFSTGGISGLSVILSGYFKIDSAANIMFVLTMALLAVGFLAIGKDTGIKTAIGSLTLSGSLLIFERLFPMTHPLTTQPLLELIFAVMLPGIGAAILFNNGGNTGGTDIVAMILKKYTSWNIALSLFVTDIFITLGAFLFGAEVGLFSVLGLAMKVLIVDSVLENLNLCKYAHIVTENPVEINHFIIHVLKRSSTIIEAEGGFTRERRFVVITALSRTQAVRLRNFLRKNYPKTFMIVTNSSEIIGKGFRGI